VRRPTRDDVDDAEPLGVAGDDLLARLDHLFEEEDESPFVGLLLVEAA
jgi:hypothetical protein